jgi:hypothetical protein
VSEPLPPHSLSGSNRYSECTRVFQCTRIASRQFFTSALKSIHYKYVPFIALFPASHIGFGIWQEVSRREFAYSSPSRRHLTIRPMGSSFLEIRNFSALSCFNLVWLTTLCRTRATRFPTHRLPKHDYVMRHTLVPHLLVFLRKLTKGRHTDEK